MCDFNDFIQYTRERVDLVARCGCALRRAESGVEYDDDDDDDVTLQCCHAGLAEWKC